MSGCSWWSIALAVVAGIAVGQVLLMASLVALTGGNPREKDEHEGGFDGNHDHGTAGGA